jgi:hypothetical protein
MILSPSGTMLGAGSMSATSSIVLSPSGVLRGLAALIGNIPLVLNVSGSALVGAGSMAGTSPIALSPVGTMSGAGDLGHASSSLILSTAGNLTGDAFLTGNIDTFLNVSDATLKGVASLPGQATLSLHVSRLTMTGAGTMSGAGSLSFDLSADIGAIVALQGTAAIVLTASGRLISIDINALIKDAKLVEVLGPDLQVISHRVGDFDLTVRSEAQDEIVATKIARSDLFVRDPADSGPLGNIVITRAG